MLPALPTLFALPARVLVRSAPLFLEERRSHGVTAEKLVDLAAAALDAPRN